MGHGPQLPFIHATWRDVTINHAQKGDFLKKRVQIDLDVADCRGSPRDHLLVSKPDSRLCLRIKMDDDGKRFMEDRKPYKDTNNPKFRGCGTMRMPTISVPSFRAAKQWFRQKVGAAERTKEPDAFISDLRHLDELDSYLRKLFVQAKRSVDKWQKGLEAHEKMLQLAGSNDEESKEVEAPNGKPLGLSRLPRYLNAIELLVAQDELLNINILKFNKLHAEMLRDQIERVVASEASDAIKARSAYYHSVLEYDACRATLVAAEKQANSTEGPPNIAHAKEHLRMSKADYENKRRSVLNAIKHLDHVMETEVTKTLEGYVANKKTSYLSLNRSLEELHQNFVPTHSVAIPIVDAKNKPEKAPKEEEEENIANHSKETNQEVESPNSERIHSTANGLVVKRPADMGEEADPMPGFYDLYTSTVERRF
ncbi:hypothetical protein AAMO2058_001218500 [Amorphochlora amoebiformis]